MKAVMRHLACAAILTSLFTFIMAQVFSPPGGGFSAHFPDTPKEATRTSNGPIGPIPVHMYSYQEDNWLYYISYSDFPHLTIGPEKTLESARDGALSSTHSTLISEKVISYDGYPGRELRMEDTKGQSMTARQILVGTRLYQVFVVTPKADALSPKIMRFLNSFHVTLGKMGA